MVENSLSELSQEEIEHYWTSVKEGSSEEMEGWEGYLEVWGLLLKKSSGSTSSHYGHYTATRYVGHTGKWKGGEREFDLSILSTTTVLGKTVFNTNFFLVIRVEYIIFHILFIVSLLHWSSFSQA